MLFYWQAIQLNKVHLKKIPLILFLVFALLPGFSQKKRQKQAVAEKSINWLLDQMEHNIDTLSFLQNMPPNTWWESFTTYTKNAKTGQNDLPNREFFLEFVSRRGSFYVQATFAPEETADTIFGDFTLKSMNLEVTVKPLKFNEKVRLKAMGYSPTKRTGKDVQMNRSISRWEGREKDIYTWVKEKDSLQHFIEVGYPFKQDEGYYCDFSYYQHKAKQK